jgi:GTP-binding protein
METRSEVVGLRLFHERQRFIAEKGLPGQGRKKTGRDGEDLVIGVPVGTQVFRLTEGRPPELLADLDELGVRLLAARGGEPGYGNRRFASPTNQVPRLAETGMPGEEVWLKLEVKLLADVGVVGVPNVGKSSLLSQSSRARPKIAPYPFTTIEPALAVVVTRGSSFVMVEVPGLVEGASRGVGLGHDFLRHAERTRVLLHLVDGTSEDIRQEYEQVSQELRAYSEALADRPRIVAVNKVDIPEVRQRVEEIQEALRGVPGPIPFISAATGEGVDELQGRVLEMLQRSPHTASRRVPGKVIETSRQPKQREEVVRIGPHSFSVTWVRAERLAARVEPGDWLATVQLMHALRRMGVAQSLEIRGAQPGDMIQIGKREFEWVG